MCFFPMPPVRHLANPLPFLPPFLPPQVLLILGIGGAVGVLGGGWVGQWCYNRRKWSMPVFIGEGGGGVAVPLCCAVLCCAVLCCAVHGRYMHWHSSMCLRSC